ncbi:MAG: zinc ribbon domain-containing protein [Oscillospiraceae bacterium]|nr:zinc ribbon domain-containing protein [Oscillospiraceae bacterium]
MPYCMHCGHQLPDDALFCDNCGAKVISIQEIDPSGMGTARFTRTYTLSEAAQIAAERNQDQEWSYWDTPDNFTYSTARLTKFCNKEDRRLGDDPDRPYYFISTGGAIGQLFIDQGSEVFEWIFFTPADNPDTLPDTLTEYNHYCFE